VDQLTAARRRYRIGIDVGGTFTKAVLIDDATRAVVGRYSVLTTHGNARGVAAGVIEVFREVLARSAVDPADVIFLAHSTTQATNALLEGDVATVGVIGLANRVEALLAKAQSRIGEIELAPGRSLMPINRFLRTDQLSDATARQAVSELQKAGARVVVASCAFGVDDARPEEQVRTAAHRLGLPATCGHEISKLYGLTTRTRTAVINASILPRMIETAEMTEASVRDAGIAAPLMIMRGDGGVMDAKEMRRRPAMTMLSGPAASVAGALLHLRVSNGIYFEVGGTSSNIGVVRNGRPTVRHARVGGHETYVNSLDVRVIGVAGGSMVRVRDGRIADVGPRSAHIAGVPYAAFTPLAQLTEPRVELFTPRPGDPADYVSVRLADGTRVAITTTCAANALGYTEAGQHAHGEPESARRALAALGEWLNVSAEAAAHAILERASDKAIAVVDSLIAEYGLERVQVMLVGEGGGAAALIPFTAERLGLRYQISPDAEVISSIGVALALVREAVERVIPNATPEALKAIRREAFDAVVALGASPDDVEVAIEINPQTQRVRAVAMGASEFRVKQAAGVTEADAQQIAAEALELEVGQVSLVAGTGRVRVFQATVVRRQFGGLWTRRSKPVAAVDADGVVRVQRGDATVIQSGAAATLPALRALWSEATLYHGDSIAPPDILAVVGARVIDLAGIIAVEQALAVLCGELDGVAPDTPVVLIAAAGRRDR
jgi:N-methylhydantoinase A/oxoprolinase/acetone carboxylase beta subunit